MTYTQLNYLDTQMLSRIAEKWFYPALIAEDAAIEEENIIIISLITVCKIVIWISKTTPNGNFCVVVKLNNHSDYFSAFLGFIQKKEIKINCRISNYTHRHN